jgi:uncharacterized SAM-binding protein YcdF (DUF218 family)
LGGGVHKSNALLGDAEASGATYSRLFNGVRIFKENNINFLVLSGTAGTYKESDAVVMSGLAEQLGIPRERIIVEATSRNTFEHAIELRKIFPAPKKVKIGIVTSAIHMRRSEMAFKRRFPTNVIVPIPVNYLYSSAALKFEDFIPNIEALSLSSLALHELEGLVFYSLQ